MTSSAENLIVIASDDESDSDIEFLREEQDDNLDVILVSHTPGARPSLGGAIKPAPQESHQEAGARTNCGLNRNLSISTNLDLALHIGETTRTSPLDLSKVPGDEGQQLPGSVPSSYDDDSSILDSDSDTQCSVDSDMGNSNLAPNTSPVQDICNLASNVSHDRDICNLVSDSSHVQDICSLASSAPHVPVICNASNVNTNSSVPLDFSNSITDASANPGCSSVGFSNTCVDSSNCQWSSEKILSQTGNIYTTDVDATLRNGNGDCNTACSSGLVGQDTPKATDNINSQSAFAGQKVKREPSSDLDTQPSCSSAKKTRLDSSVTDDPLFDLESWDSVKKDLDFLNAATNTQSLSNSSFPTSDHSLSNPFYRKPSTDGSSVSPSSGGAGPALPSSSSNSVSQSQRRDWLLGVSDNTPSSSSSSYTSHLPPKKQLHVRCFRQNSEPGTMPTPGSTMPTPGSSGWRSETCSNCKMSLLGSNTSRCLQGHATCSSCLEEIVKLVLTGKSKESLRCAQAGCDSYYPKSELNRSLPSMVVEILNDKLDNDHIEYIANMLMKNAGSSTQTDTQKPPSPPTPPTQGSEEGESGKFSKTEYKRSCSEPDLHSHHNELPSHWDGMDLRTGPYKLTVLEPDTPEYVEVALKFHDSLVFPTADVKKISRVQNPILWKYYTVKKTEMIQENDGHAVEERSLFHGTNTSVVEAICKKGFDWRVCGKHGTVYGQGSYFAADASYSHQYTDNRDRLTRRRIATQMFHSSSFHHRPISIPTFHTRLGPPPLQIHPQGPQDLSQNSSSQNILISQSSNQQGPAAPGNQHNSTISSSTSSSFCPVISSPFVPYQPPIGNQPQQQPIQSASFPGPSNQQSNNFPQLQTNNFSQQTYVLNTPQTSGISHKRPVVKFSVTSAQSSSSQNSNTVDASSSQSGGLKLKLAKSSGNSYKVMSNTSSTNTGADDAKKNGKSSDQNLQSSDRFQKAVEKLKDILKTALKNGDTVQRDKAIQDLRHARSIISGSKNDGSKTGGGTSSNSQVVSTQTSKPLLRVPLSSLCSTSSSPFSQSGMRLLYRSHSITRYGPARNPVMSSILSSSGDQEDGGQGVKTSHRMFLAKVLVGRYTGGSAALRKPPPLDELNDPYGKCYDSCVDHIYNPKIFVVFDSAQAYPEYLIEYEFTA